MPRRCPHLWLLLIAAIPPAAAPRTAHAQGQGQDQPPHTFTEQLAPYLNPPQLQGKTNAAFEYLKAWDTLSGRDRIFFNNHYIWFARGDKVGEELKRSQMPENSGLTEPDFLARHADLVQSLIRAAAVPDCRWGIAPDPDIENLQFFAPAYMQPMRSSSWLLAADADRCLDEHNPSAATDRIVALIQMSCLLHEDRYLILANVSSQWCRAALDLADRMLLEKTMSPANARRILTALKAVSRDDPFGLCTSIEGDEHRWLRLLQTKYTGPNAGAHLIHDMNNTGYESDYFTLACGLKEDQLQPQLRLLEKYFARYAALWRQPDAAAQRSELAEEAAEGQYGLLPFIVPTLSRRYYEIVMQVRARIDATSQDLAAVINPAQNAPPGPQTQP